MNLCNLYSDNLTELQLILIAILGGIFVSFSIGAFFSVTYTVPSHLACVEMNKTGKEVASMYFAVQGIFEGIASGVASGLILVYLKANDVILLLPIIVVITSLIAFMMSFAFHKNMAFMGKENKEQVD